MSGGAMRRAIPKTLLVLLAGAASPPATAAQTLGVTSPFAAPPPRWRFLPAVAFGYDSFGQKYSIAEDDTLDLLDELSGRLVTSIEHQGTTRLWLRNTFAVGQEATREELQASAARSFGRLELRGEQELRYKGYAPNSDYRLSSDYWTGTTRAAALVRLGPSWRLRLDDRFEWTAFDSTDRYNYDYRLNDTAAEVEREYGFLSSLRAGYTYGFRSVPDSSVIDYRRHLLRADWEHDSGTHGVRLDERVERRLYRDPTVRSHYTDWWSELAGRIGLHPRLRLRPEYRASLLRYDTPDSVFSNADEQSAEMLVEGDLSDNAILALGPRAEFRRTQSTADRAYNQWGLKGSVTYALGSSLWLQFTDEVGTRTHLAGDDVLVTDFVFNWSTLYLTWQPRPRLALDLFFALNPEVHDEAVNDTTTLLLSTSVTVGWR